MSQIEDNPVTFGNRPFVYRSRRKDLEKPIGLRPCESQFSTQASTQFDLQRAGWESHIPIFPCLQIWSERFIAQKVGNGHAATLAIGKCESAMFRNQQVTLCAKLLIPAGKPTGFLGRNRDIRSRFRAA